LFGPWSQRGSGSGAPHVDGSWIKTSGVYQRLTMAERKWKRRFSKVIKDF
jgi:hypothetical protein